MPRHYFELDESGDSREGEGLERQGVHLLPAVLQLLAEHLCPGPSVGEGGGQGEGPGGPVPVLPVVGVDQLGPGQPPHAAQVQHELPLLLVARRKPEVRHSLPRCVPGQQVLRPEHLLPVGGDVVVLADHRGLRRPHARGGKHLGRAPHHRQPVQEDTPHHGLVLGQ